MIKRGQRVALSEDKVRDHYEEYRRLFGDWVRESDPVHEILRRTLSEEEPIVVGFDESDPDSSVNLMYDDGFTCSIKRDLIL